MLWFLSETTEQIQQDWGTALGEEIQHQGGLEENRQRALLPQWIAVPTASCSETEWKPMSWHWVNHTPSSVSRRFGCVGSWLRWWDAIPSTLDGKGGDTWIIMLCDNCFWQKEKETWERKLLSVLRWAAIVWVGWQKPVQQGTVESTTDESRYQPAVSERGPQFHRGTGMIL